jgi:PKD repeat protein
MASSGHSTTTSNFSWNFGKDAQPATSSNYKPPLVYWTTPGSKVITLTITSGTSRTVKSQVYEVFPYPIADFSINTASSTCAASPYEVAFSPLLASGNLYQWDFGPAGSPSTSTSASPKAIYNASGTYPVQLTVINNGCRAVNAKNVTVGNGACGIASLSAGISIQPSRAGCASNEYLVQSTSTGNITNSGYTWTFPGNPNATKTGPGPKTLILNPGEVVTLQVVDQNGKTDTISVKAP